MKRKAGRGRMAWPGPQGHGGDQRRQQPADGSGAVTVQKRRKPVFLRFSKSMNCCQVLATKRLW